MTTAPAPVTGAEPTPRRLSHRQTGSDAVFVHVSRAIGATVLVITGGVGLFLGWQAIPTLQHYGWSFFTETQWQPEADIVGIAAVLVGTVSVALVAMVDRVPAGAADRAVHQRVRPGAASSRRWSRWST